jgi:hypothetical protein
MNKVWLQWSLMVFYVATIIVVLCAVLLQPSPIDLSKSKVIVPTPGPTYIPRHIFQTHAVPFDQLPAQIKASCEQLRDLHPTFKYMYFDNETSRQFLVSHHSSSVVHAYDTLIPGAYKADLFRYCVLYTLGGVYMDCGFTVLNNFRLDQVLGGQKFVSVMDSLDSAIYQAFLACTPKHPVLWDAIQQIVQNVATEFYGKTFLHPTGPFLLGDSFIRVYPGLFIREGDQANHVRLLGFQKGDFEAYGTLIFRRQGIIRTKCPHYRQESEHMKPLKEHYTRQWTARNIYHQK